MRIAGTLFDQIKMSSMIDRVLEYSIWLSKNTISSLTVTVLSSSVVFYLAKADTVSTNSVCHSTLKLFIIHE